MPMDRSNQSEAGMYPPSAFYLISQDKKLLISIQKAADVARPDKDIIYNLVFVKLFDSSIGKLRSDFLMKHHIIFYNELILTGRFYASLFEIEALDKACLDTVVPLADAEI